MILEDEYRNILRKLSVRLNGKMRNRPVMDFQSNDRGGALEFADYHPYTAGDCVRHIDWNRYLTDSHMVVRRFHKYERPEITLVPDLSASVCAGGKAEAVRKLSAAVGFCVLNSGMKLRLLSMIGQCTQYVGTSGISRFLADVQGIPADKCHCLSLSGSQMDLSDNVVLITDLVYYGVDHMKNNLRLTGRACSIFRLETGSDRNPELRGYLRLRDSQNGKVRKTIVNNAVLEGYIQAYQQYFKQVKKYSNGQGWRITDIDVDLPFLQQLKMAAPGGSIFV